MKLRVVHTFDFSYNESIVREIRQPAVLFYLHYFVIMSRIGNYLRDTAAEMKHVSWPTQTQALIYTVLVVGICTVTAIMLSSFDYVFTSLLNMVV